MYLHIAGTTGRPEHHTYQKGHDKIMNLMVTVFFSVGQDLSIDDLKHLDLEQQG